MNLFLSILLTLGLLAAPVSDPDENAPREGIVALTNARIVTVTNGVIENGTLVIQDNQIVALGANVSVPAGAQVIDCTGLTIDCGSPANPTCDGPCHGEDHKNDPW